MRSETALSGKALATDVAMEGPVLSPLDLGVMVPQVLLKVGELDEGASTVGEVAFVRTLAWKERKLGLSPVLSPSEDADFFFMTDGKGMRFKGWQCA